MRVAVTGASGMLGRALIPALRTAGGSVLALARADADVTRIQDLRDRFAAFRPDWVFHLAAFTRVNDCETQEALANLVNQQGAANTAKAAAEVGAAVLMVSTDYVFDGRAKQPYRESDTPDPVNAYGRSKLAGEVATREANPRHMIVRTAWLYGRGGRNFPDTLRAQARAGRPLRVVNDQRGSPTWTEDLAPALVRLASSGRFGTFHCTNSGDCTWFEFAQHLVERCGLSVAVEPVASDALGIPAVPRPLYSVLSNRLYEQVTGHQMPSWRDAADRYLTSLAPAPSPATDGS